MRLEDVFERIVVINLPFKEDRRTRLLTHFEEVNIVNPKCVHWHRGICGDWTPPPKWFGAGNGAWGCLMSHVRVAQDAAHDKIESYLVLEDDVIFHQKSAEMLASFMREVPSDWEQLYLGGQFLHKKPERISPWVMRPYNVNRTHAFALRKKTIPRFLQHVLHAPEYFSLRSNEQGGFSIQHNAFHIDHQLGRAHERKLWQTYAPTWWLAGQEGGKSNISGKTNPRLWWNWRELGQRLPFVFLPINPSQSQMEAGRRYLHAGNNLAKDSLIDIGITKRLGDEDLKKWLEMIAGEAVELWKLPGFEIPAEFPDLPARAAKVWNSGLLHIDQASLETLQEYPFNTASAWNLDDTNKSGLMLENRGQLRSSPNLGTLAACAMK